MCDVGGVVGTFPLARRAASPVSGVPLQMNMMKYRTYLIFGAPGSGKGAATAYAYEHGVV